MENKKIVVTYENADLDCVASAYAYSEYLNKKGEKSSYFISGIIQKEVDIVAREFNIDFSNSAKEIKDEDIIVVDTNTLSSINYVNPNNIIEFIDHHPNSGDIKYCKKAKLNLYEVGAVCTIIAEMFKNNNIEMSRETAILLYYGIISNTVNLKSKVTTNKDYLMTSWLKQQCNDINESIIFKIFEEKSQIDINNLRRAMEVEEKFICNNDEMIIGQLEIVNAYEFFIKYKYNIDNILSKVQKEYNVKYSFINIIDILNGYHFIYACDNNSKSYIEEKYNVKLNEGIYKEEKIVLRKEIKKYLNEVYSNKKIK